MNSALGLILRGLGHLLHVHAPDDALVGVHDPAGDVRPHLGQGGVDILPRFREVGQDRKSLFLLLPVQGHDLVDQRLRRVRWWLPTVELRQP